MRISLCNDTEHTIHKIVATQLSFCGLMASRYIDLLKQPLSSKLEQSVYNKSAWFCIVTKFDEIILFNFVYTKHKIWYDILVYEVYTWEITKESRDYN